MRKTLLLLVGVFILSSGAVFGNSLYDQMAGRWSVVTKSSAGNSGRAPTYRMQFRVLQDGTLYTSAQARFKGHLFSAKTWAFTDGTFREASYENGQTTKEMIGTWEMERVSLGRWISETTYLDGSTSFTVIRKVNRNKFIARSTSTDGSRVTSTYTRIRN